MEQIAEIISFLIVLWVLWKYVLPLIKNMITNRQAAIQQQVDDSAEAERLNAEAKSRYDSAIADARTEAARLRDDARADATTIRAELVAQAERDVERIKQRGAEQLVAEREQIMRHLRAEVGGQSVQLAERLVIDSLADDASKSASVDDFLAGLGDLATRTTTTGATTGGGA